MVEPRSDEKHSARIGVEGETIRLDDPEVARVPWVRFVRVVERAELLILGRRKGHDFRLHEGEGRAVGDDEEGLLREDEVSASELARSKDCDAFRLGLTKLKSVERRGGGGKRSWRRGKVRRRVRVIGSEGEVVELLPELFASFERRSRL